MDAWAQAREIAGGRLEGNRLGGESSVGFIDEGQGGKKSIYSRLVMMLSLRHGGKAGNPLAVQGGNSGGGKRKYVTHHDNLES